MLGGNSIVRALPRAGRSQMDREQLRRIGMGASFLVLVAIALLTLTSLGGVAGPNCTFGLPCWVGHFVLFWALGCCLGVWFAASEAARRQPRRTFLLLLALGVAIGGLDELLQAQVGRDAEVMDFVVDAFGVLDGLLTAGIVLRFWYGRQRGLAVSSGRDRASRRSRRR